MFKRLMTGLGTLPTRLLLFVALPGCLVWLALTFFRGPAPVAFRAAQATKASEVAVAPKAAPGKLEGEEARVYLEQTSEGQSLMKTLEAERFGLKWQQRAPFRGEGKGGYLGLSHDENLNAWFDEEGATIRPTVSEKERDRAWHLGLRLKSYGYGNKLKAAPPVLSRNVVENRIEYTRDGSTNPQSAGPNPKLIEWYVNKSEGIEQGFTLSGPPARQEGIAGDEPLRLVVSVTGDLRARAADDGQAVELNKNGAGVLSYSHLVASDATGRRLAARMETNEAGDEIALVVDDAEAEYPIVVDPITTTLEKKLEAEPEGQAEARFGFAVAISGDRAVVGAWREDASIPGGTIIDIGAVYNFSRSGTQWSYVRRVVSGSDGDQCGWSVAINNGGQIVSGCPGTNSSAGRAIFYDSSVGLVTNINPLLGSKAGDRFGESVAIGSNRIIVGSPFADSFGADSGSTAVYAISGSTIQPLSAFGTPGSPPNGHAGTAVAISGNLIVTGSPGSGPGKATVYDYATDSFFDLLASDGVNGDLFGNSVAISGDTVVVGAPLDDNQRGVDAGAAYVFVRNGSGQWTQQQKLMASDGHAGDFFSEHAVAIEGNTLVVGAYSNGNPLGDNSGNDDDRGAAYVFTRSGTTWTQQTKISQTNFAGGEAGAHFGIDVDLSGTTVLIGARGGSGGGIVRAGAAFVYRLDCLPPTSSYTTYDPFIFSNNRTVCPGSSTTIYARHSGTQNNTSYQWRRNGVNIPGANSFEYTINNVGAGDAGSYDVIISNACGSEISEPTTLAVHSFSLNPTSQNFSASGSNGIVNVASTGSSCGWTATSNASWITVTSGASGTGNGTVGFTVAANTVAGQRTGTLTIAGQTFTVSQDGLNCSYSINPTTQNFTASGGSNSVGVTATAGCPWTATSNTSWLSVTSGASGSGNGTVNYSATANTGPQRTGTLTVAGQTFTVTQASGCTFSINPTAQGMNAGGGTASVAVTAGGGCDWTATNNSPSFITITSGASGTGSGTVNYSISANTSTSQRTGTMTIAGQTFTVTQAGAAPPSPTVQLSQTSYSVSEGAGFASITVTRSDSSQPATVKYQTSDITDVNFRCDPTTAGQITGSASRKCDYHIASGRLRFGVGESSKQIILSIVDDVYVEGSETFTVTLSNPAGMALGANTSAVVNITDNDTGGQPNPIDQTAFFVRMLYVDLLSREPDAAGLAGWIHRIDFCGQPGEPPPPCDRVTVGGDGFLRSSEFFDRQFFVLRLYKTAFGRILQYSEVGDLAYVSGFLSPADLELNKQELVAEIMTRQEFTNRYGGLGDAAFVDTLLQTAGVTVPSSVRSDWLVALAVNSKSRAQVFREISERPEVSAKHLVESQVVSAYYGFFTRNPDGAYISYVTRLNSGEINLGDLANAFINAAEYRQRFGP